MSCDASELEWTASQNPDEPLSFFSEGRTALDLTGSIVSLVVMESFSDEEPWEVFSQDTHIDAAAGETTLSVDLTDLLAEWRTSGKRLVGSRWVVDAQGKVNPWGNYAIQIQPPAPLPS